MKVKPFESKAMNYFELYNEATILSCSYVIIVNLGLLSDTQMRYDFGWFLIALILANIGINLIRIFKTLCRKIFKQVKSLNKKCTKKHSTKAAKHPSKLQAGDGVIAAPQALAPFEHPEE